ncbi:radical SAM family heme chaperone HemW [Moraxella nasovis]|uniref:radical SAM family heme chaperone HemW n=1 Tax=Moraxella nasovis TaxID=2904121 RepID=UPI001F6258AA|nr:radical SAM family heme chaperone HemW [Moraxella nasovis]UNU73416.1 radical SAM family heme chaperone HemW [Moraxella nasovis]
MLDSAVIPLALYIHIPWCVKKCPYCDFNSHALTDRTPFSEYVDALLLDARSQIHLAQDRPISSVFIGGGTPSLLPIHEFMRLFHGLREMFSFQADCEITLEANPATLEHAPFADYLEVGINRLSIGVQSFNDKALNALGRIHNSHDAINAIKSARAAGFIRVNADLMHGLPHQTPKLAYRDLSLAIDSGATHISWYQLTIEPNTAFFRSPPDLPDEDTLEAIEMTGKKLLLDHGFYNYEVSAWGGKDGMCRHNINYWQFGDYLAIGAGAHGKVTLSDDGIYRFYKSRLPKDYLSFDTHPKMVKFTQILDDELIGEFMMNALRLRQGVSIDTFRQRTGLGLDCVATTIASLQNQGLLINSPDIIAPTELGFRYVNHLVGEFFN